MAKTRILITLVTLIVVVFAATIAILYAKGYRINQEDLSLTPSGLLVANSDPNGAEVFINGELKTATNNTINLEPGDYEVTVKKEGFLNWTKRLTIKKEEVTQIDVFLLPSAPSLTAITFSGAFSPTASNDLTKIAYGVPPRLDNLPTNGDGPEKAGLWVLETSDLPLGFSRDARQITDGDLTDATWEWSPDGREILLTTKTGVFLLEASTFTPQTRRVNITTNEKSIRLEWKKLIKIRHEAALDQLPDEVQGILERRATDIRFAPDESKVIYTASGSATLKEGITKSLPGASTQKQERDIKDGQTYVYDIKEDRNFLVAMKDEVANWLPNSLNLAKPEKDKITVMDYDGTNRQDIFAGAYSFPYAFPSSSGNKILVLTNLGATDKPENLYWLSLK